jgi:hypothetical protein
VQCKNKSIWPPTKLTKKDVDEEVRKAKTWKPALKHYNIATTAPNDDTVQAHARKLTEKHKEKGLFSVTIVSWDEITRRLASYPGLLSKYGYAPDITLVQKIEAVPAETAKLVAKELRAKGAPQRDIAQDAGVAEALERDLAARFDRSMRRSFFPETFRVDEYVSVAEIATEAQYATIAPSLRRRIFLRAARSAAVRGALERAHELLQKAQSLVGTDSDLLARARILERGGDIDTAMTLTESLFALGTAQRDLQLEIAIAVESGEWESLAKPLAAFLDDVPRYSGLMLIRAAHIAQQSGHGPLFDLVKAAVSKADNDPHVWLGA